MEWLACILIALAIAAGCSWYGYREGYRRGKDHALPTALLEELTDLRFLKHEIETPPNPHEHIWPREPDMRIPYWLRYRCAVKGCTQFNWAPVGPRHKTVEPTSADYGANA